MADPLKECPGCGGTDTRVIGGPETRGGPQYWAGCDHCRWRTWGNTEAEAIEAWNTRHGAGDAEDAARYRWLSRKVSAHALHGIGYTFAFPTHLTLPAPPSVMGGSVAQHLDAAIDAARAREGEK